MRRIRISCHFRARPAARGAVARATARERRRLAGELHDSVGHRLVVIAMRARHAESCSGRCADEFRQVDAAAAEALHDIRRIVGVLRAPAPVPLSAGVADAVSRIPDQALSVSVRTIGTERRVPARDRVAALRVVEEGLTNAVKHAGRGSAAVTVEYEPELAVWVRSRALPGRAAGPALPGGGHGLAGLRERVRACGGVFEQRAGDGEFSIRAVFPAVRGATG